MNALEVLTPWQPLLRPDGTEDVDSHPFAVPGDLTRHRLFQQRALEVMDATYPWLRRLLEAAQAQVLARDGAFYIAMPSQPDEWIEVPALSAQLWLMPWAEDGETPH